MNTTFPAYLYWLMFAIVCGVGVLALISAHTNLNWRKRLGNVFTDTLPYTRETKPIGLTLEFESSKALQVLPDTKLYEPIVIKPGDGVLITPYLPEGDNIVSRLVMRQWIIGAGKRTHLKDLVLDGGKRLFVHSDNAPVTDKPEQLYVCFEAIDVKKSITYQIDISFIHSS